MKLNHINLTVTDVVETRKFLIKYFGLEDRYPETGNKGFAVLFDDDDLILTLIKGRASEVKYPPTFHIGFGQATPEHVNEINQRLKDDGYDVEPPSEQHGAWTFYFTAPGGFQVEVLC